MFKKIKAKLKKYVRASSDFGFYRILNRELKGYKSVLDVGCGTNSPIAKLTGNYYLEGFDVIPENLVDKINLKQGKKKNISGEVYLNKIHDKYTQGNILKIEKYFKNKTFDVVVLFEVIEHLPRSEGKKMLEKLEKIAKHKIIITTPNGFIPQGFINGNAYQEHLSGWFENDFRSRGYHVYGIHGFKFIRGEFAAIKYKPWYVWLYISYLSEFITINFPKFAFGLMAVKTFKK